MSDIEIARKAKKKHIKEIQDELGIKKYKIQKPNLKSR